MAVTKKEFTELLGESISADLAAEAPPADSGEQVFSEAFEKRMSDFFSGKRSGKAKLRPKRWLIAAIAAVLLLAAVACAVPEIRRSIAGFFIRIFGDHVEYTDPDITKDRIEEEYGLVPIPEGFEETTSIKNNSAVITDYFDEQGNYISLKQVAYRLYSVSIDNENGYFEEETINGIAMRVYRSENVTEASWIEDGYYFSLLCSFQADDGFFRELISNVRIK